MTFTLGNSGRYETTPIFHTAPEQDHLMLPDKLLHAAHIYLSIPNQVDSMLKSLPGFSEEERFSVCTAPPIAATLRVQHASRRDSYVLIVSKHVTWVPLLN